MHLLIVGARGAGKSTLIKRVLSEIDCLVCGFLTKKEDDLAVEGQGSPIYIYEFGKEKTQGRENLLGHCNNQHCTPIKETFDSYAPKLQMKPLENSLVVMDELGFMESVSEVFCSSVLGLLDGDVPVLATVKNKETEFLNAVREHHNARCFFLTVDNREKIFGQVINCLIEMGYKRKAE